jgi:hypothetical protein
MLYQHEATRTCFKIESLDLHGLQLQDRQYEELLRKHEEEVQVKKNVKKNVKKKERQYEEPLQKHEEEVQGPCI